MTMYNTIAENPQSTVVAEYAAEYRTAKAYQSEAELERAFIDQLQSQAYEYLSITTEADLVLNLRQQLEKLNDFTFSDSEWERFFTGEIANPNQSIAEKTATIQEDHIKNLKRDDGTVKNVYLLRKDKIHENSLQVINQYTTTPSPDGATPPVEGNENHSALPGTATTRADERMVTLSHRNKM
jgi:type I restriction enzyme R subunit